MALLIGAVATMANPPKGNSANVKAVDEVQVRSDEKKTQDSRLNGEPLLGADLPISYVTVTVDKVDPPLWFAPQSEHDDLHYVRREGDRCYIGGQTPSEEWCDATFVHTLHYNLSPFDLHVTVACSAFDLAGRMLATDTGFEDNLAAHKQGATAFVRFAKVKYDDVARVECHPTKVKQFLGYKNN